MVRVSGSAENGKAIDAGRPASNARVIRDPRLLPYYLDREQAAALCLVKPGTLKKWRAAGVLRERLHFVKRRSRVVYLRDGLIDFMDGRDRGQRPAPAPLSSTLNPARSPALAAALYREAHGR